MRLSFVAGWWPDETIATLVVGHACAGPPASEDA